MVGAPDPSTPNALGTAVQMSLDGPRSPLVPFLSQHRIGPCTLPASSSAPLAPSVSCFFPALVTIPRKERGGGGKNDTPPELTAEQQQEFAACCAKKPCSDSNDCTQDRCEVVVLSSGLVPKISCTCKIASLPKGTTCGIEPTKCSGKPVSSCDGEGACVLSSAPTSTGQFPLNPRLPSTVDQVSRFLQGCLQTPASAPVWAASSGLAMVSGRVVDRKGNAIQGAKVRVVRDATESAQTLQGSTETTDSGRFDFRVFGGRTLTLAFEKAGFLPVQRQVRAPLDGYGNADVVALTPAAPPSSVTLGASGAWASGVQVTDSAGPRTARIFFPAGVAAYEGATKLPLNLQVHLTEFTVGADGPAAMPGTLPPSTAYTYAADFSINGKESQSISFKDASGNPTQVFAYVEDILAERKQGRCLGANLVTGKCTKPGAVSVKPRLKVGTVIPSGSYDPADGQWKPGPNGRVIRLLAVQNGLASVDTDGDGKADNTGLSTEERQGLASTYGVGSQLWRVPLPHFSAWDFNFPFGPCADCKPPGDLDPRTVKAPGNTLQDGAMCTSGSVIQCENQVVGESVLVLGTGMRLAYASDRVPGRTSEKNIEIPLTNPKIEKIPSKVHVETAIAGQINHKTYAYGKSTEFFSWNGLDAQGRRVQGAQKLHIRLGYEYPATYYTSQQAAQQIFLVLGGYDGFDSKNVEVVQGKEGASTILWRDWTLTLENFNAQPLGLGGWTLSHHHTLDPVGGTLYRGDGSTFQPRLLGSTFKTRYPFDNGAIVAGPGKDGYPTDGVLTALPDGSLLVPAVNSGDDFYLFRIDPQGKVSVFAGKNGTCSLDDNGGGDPTQASLCKVKHISVSKDGNSVYLASENPNNASRLKRIFRDPSKPNGWSIETIAGTCLDNCNSTGDDGPAAQANFKSLDAIAPGPDGSLFVRDDTALRRILPDGRIVRLTGNSGAVVPGKSVSETLWDAGQDAGQSSLLVDGQGRIYFLNASSSPGNIFRVDPDGIIRTALSDPAEGIRQIILDQEDRLLFLQDPPMAPGLPGNRIRLVEPNGSLQTVVAGLSQNDANNGLAYSAYLNQARGIAADSKGNILVHHKDQEGKSYFSVIEPLSPQVNNANLVVAEPSGNLLHVFSSAGQHEKTILASTGHALWSFEYDQDGLLTGVLDRDGRKTTVVRSGQQVLLTSPDSHKTQLTLDASDWLTKVSYPDASSQYPGGVAFSMQHLGNGLLQTFTDPRGNQHVFQYGFFGRLIKDSQPLSAGGSKSLVMTKGNEFWEVAVSTAEQRTTTHRIQFSADGTRSRTLTSPEGMVSSLIESPDQKSLAQVRPSSGSPVLMEQETKLAPDALFGMAAPHVRSQTVSFHEPGQSTFASASVDFKDTSPAPSNGLLGGLSRSATITVQGQSWKLNYDAQSRVQTIETPSLLDTSKPLAFFTQVDSKGRPVEITFPWAQQPIAISYFSSGPDLGRISQISQGTRTLTPSYSNGFLSGLAAPENMSMSVPAGQLDALGRPRKIQRSGLVDTLDLDYDKSGNVTLLTPPGKPNPHLFSHDAMDREDTYTPPGVTDGGSSSKNKYTKDGNIEQVTTPGGRVFSFTYNDLKKRLNEVDVQAKDLADPNLSSYTLSLDYDPQQRIQTLSASDESLSFAYTGSLLRKITSSGTVNGSVGFDYDAQFRVTAEKVNDSSVVSYTYDSDGALRTASLQDSEFRFRRNAQGQVKDSTLAFGSNAIIETYTYDPAYGDLMGTEATRNGQVLYRYTIEQRDNLGREKIRREFVGGSFVGAQETRVRYEYDAAGRLSKVFPCNLAGDINCTSNLTPAAEYKYDDNGNLTSAPFLFSPSYDAQDRLLSSLGTIYDSNAEGWRTKTTLTVFNLAHTYHPSGHLLSDQSTTSRVAYVLDPLGRRIQRSTGPAAGPLSVSSRFLYRDALRPVAELDPSNALRSRFVFASGRNVPDFLWRDGVPFRILTDPRGSVRMVVNVVTGEVTQKMRHDAWGNVEEDTAPGWQPFGYAGGLHEPVTGTVRFGAREYDGKTGRWMQKDPIRFAGGDSNLYAYVQNDPLNFTDPSGMLGVGVGIVISGGSVIGSSYSTGVLMDTSGSETGPYTALGDGLQWPSIGGGFTMFVGDPSGFRGYGSEGGLGYGICSISFPSSATWDENRSTTENLTKYFESVYGINISFGPSLSLWGANAFFSGTDTSQLPWKTSSGNGGAGGTLGGPLLKTQSENRIFNWDIVWAVFPLGGTLVLNYYLAQVFEKMIFSYRSGAPLILSILATTIFFKLSSFIVFVKISDGFASGYTFGGNFVWSKSNTIVRKSRYVSKAIWFFSLKDENMKIASVPYSFSEEFAQIESFRFDQGIKFSIKRSAIFYCVFRRVAFFLSITILASVITQKISLASSLYFIVSSSLSAIFISAILWYELNSFVDSGNKDKNSTPYRIE